MKKSFIIIAATSIFITVTFVVSCKKNAAEPVYMLEPKQDVFSVDYSCDVMNPSATIGRVNIDNNKAALGRLLFYDNRLSVNGKINCGTCHIQSHGFADGKAKSTGFLQGTTARNSMGLINMDDQSSFVKSKTKFFWDGRASSLKELALGPAKNHVEMGMDNGANIVKAISNVSIYSESFKKYSMGITESTISDCIAEFVRSLQGFKSKFDEGLLEAGITDAKIIPVKLFPNFTDDENTGKYLFYSQYNCINCHGTSSKLPQVITNSGYGGNNLPLMMNIGLDADGENVGEKARSFKAPTLRNIELTGPYMHDGRFATLEDVLKHYSEGIKMNVSLAPELRSGNSTKAKKFDISDSDKKSLIAFLKTLTDASFIADKRFSNPYLP